MKNKIKLLAIGREWGLIVLFLVATTTVVKAADYTYTINSDNTNTITITAYNGTNDVLVIPSTIDGKTITGINLGGFWGGNNNVSSITIPSSVTNIVDAPFIGWSKLTAITVDAINSFYSSTDGVLFNKNQTKLIEYPRGKSGSYTISDSVTSIGANAFRYSSSLTSVTIGNNVTNIGEYAFNLCTSLPSVTIPNSVINIGTGAFYSCTGLTNVTIGNGVTSIEAQAFYNCYSLTSVIIGNSVTNIGDLVFSGCTDLTGVYFLGNAPNIGTAIFAGDNSAIVYYLAGTTGWGSTFGGRPTMIWNPPSAPTNVSASDGTYTDMVSITWSVVSEVTNYELWRHISNNSNLAVKIIIPDLTTTNYNDTNVTAGICYYYWVKAVSAAGASSFSTPDSGFIGIVGPMITANGQVGDVPLDSGDTVTISVQMMNIEPYLGAEVDWWVVARAGSSWYYLNNSIQWTPFDGNLSNCHPVYQGGLFNLPETEVLNIRLGSGSYTFWFVVDYPMDGILNVDGPILVDSVNVIVE